MKLTTVQKSRIVASFRLAAYHQLLRWDFETAIEDAVGMELSTEDAIKDIAAMFDRPELVAVVSQDIVFEALNKHNPEAKL